MFAVMDEFSPIDPIRRLVTSHNERGQAIVWRDHTVRGKLAAHGNAVSLLWSSESHPAEITSTEDKGQLETGLVNSGSVLRIVDFCPHSFGRLHRSISLDYVLVLKGSIVLALDDGSRTTVNEGDLVVQQATMHGWDNESDQWARILCCLIPAEAPVIGGQKLETLVDFVVK